MRTNIRIAGISLLAFGGVTLAQVVVQQAAQVQIAPAAAQPAKEDPKAKAKAASVEVMTFPSDRDAKNMIQAVKDYMKEFEEKPTKAPWDKICQAAQSVLDAKSDSFFELTKPSPDAPQGRVSAKAEINRLIGLFPTEGRQFYQLAYGANAEAQLAQARNANYDRAILSDISQRYFHTKAGAQATLLLAAVQLERGNYVESAYSYERLLARPDAEELWTPLTIFKAVTAMKRAGANLESHKKLSEKLEKKFPRDGLTIGRRNYSLDELRMELDRVVDSLHFKVSEAYSSQRFGNPSHTALFDGGKPFLDPVWSQTVFRNMASRPVNFLEGNTWTKQNLDDVLRTINPLKHEVAIPGFFPATAQNLVFFRSYDGLYAFITKDGFNNHGRPSRAGDIAWFSPMNGAIASLVANAKKPDADGFRTEDIETYWRYYRDQVQMKSLLFDNPLTGSVTHDGQAVYLVDDAALPPPPPNPNNEFGFVPVNATGQGGAKGGRSKSLTDGSRLISIDIATGRRQWVIGEPINEKPFANEEEEEKSTNVLAIMANSYFLGPPLPLHGKLYVLYEHNGVIRLACLDPTKLETHMMFGTKEVKKVKWGKEYTDREPTTYPLSYPALVWNQKLGEPNVRLPADTYRRFQCSYLAFSDGVMVCPTNAGAVVAVDIMNRSLLWARSYRTLETKVADVNNMRRGGMIGAGVTGGGSPLNNDRLRAAAPIISQGRVVFGAFDSKHVFCLDLRSGEVLWREPVKAGDLYVGGLVGENVLIVNKESMRAVKLKGPAKKTANADGKEDVAYAWKDLKIGLPAGHGVASKENVYYLPVAMSADDPQPQVWAIDAIKGEIQAKATFRKKDLSEGKPMLGNLVFHEEQLYSQSPTELTVFPLIEFKKRQMNDLLSKNPKDPAGLVARGEMLFDEGKIPDAIADFTMAAKNSPSDATLARLREKLFLAYTKLLRDDFNNGESFLEEYKGLCVVKADSEDPNVLLRQKEESDRRHRLFLELLAKGREKQGRLTEAFDYYREFAGFGGNKELVSLSDELHGKTRPDVWARGRIEAMIRNAKDESVRKPLEALVDREWNSVKGGQNLPKLRDFVSIFGQHFAVGRQAELLLGEMLLASEKPEDHREAQAVLTRLAATSEEPTLAARAIEGLAKLATRNGQTDTAVSFYAVLGTTYAAVKVREGRTGADIFNDLLTDKRLLPHLEPARLPTPARIAAQQDTSRSNVYVPPGYVLEPEGAEREPFYRRHRIVLSNNDGGGLWALRVTDRSTGEEKWKHGGLQMFNPNQNGLVHRIAQARGSLLLLHMGFEVHCLDLAEKKHLWKYPIFGEGGKTMDWSNLRTEIGPDDELTIYNNSDGTRFTIGRTTILETNYTALVTRDGLVALDPSNGSKLWTRTNVNPSAMIFGDPLHIFVVETTGGKSTSKVFRAIDGTPVEGVPDFTAMMSKERRERIVGRHILLKEDNGRSKPLVLRLYDPLTGKDAWKKEYAPMAEPEDYKSKGLEFNGRARVIKTFSPEYTGVFERDGKFEVIDVLTGNVTFKGRIDAKNTEMDASMTSEAVLLADADRYYLLLNRSTDPNRNVVNYYGYYNQTLRAIPVNGPIYCYEKATGVRAWFADKVFENQQLIVERFAEIPALVVATYMQDEDDGPQNVGMGRRGYGGNQAYKVRILDKVNGRLRFDQNMNQNGSNFYAIDTDPRKGEARLLRHDLSIVIKPDDRPTEPTGLKAPAGP